MSFLIPGIIFKEFSRIFAPNFNHELSVEGTPPFGKPEKGIAVATVALTTKSQISLNRVKETLVDSDLISGVSAGDTMEYEADIKNVGATTLSNVDITSSLLNQRIQR